MTLADLLRQLEWGTEGMCPLCRAIGGGILADGSSDGHDEPHKPDCPVSMWIARLDEVDPYQLLKGLEWSADDLCPECCGIEPRHSEDCRIGSALAHLK